ncbi:LANO_0H13278g1_1 [Lachancea nothofagi CBS 11611]|uniref:Superoxide dismutase 1 copper chaperone n=1 Tax=Lachancea nothofagi CBS 11611 TaxID=1266666 RepID=A0A1G4KMJ8_9SACH|nr:LANO_0H13278g1_1 [Lachancea nothofagi CBS 11611]
MTKTTPEDSFEATYAVEMHCDSCVKDITSCLSSIPDISLDFHVQQKLLAVTGAVAPSVIISTLQKCGRDAIIRGTGKADSAAVSILETFEPVGVNDTPVRGLARIVSVSDTKTWVDITLNGLHNQGNYYASIRECGDISNGAASTGGSIYRFPEPIECKSKSDLGKNLYSGQAFLSAPLQVWELLGRSFMVTTDPEHRPGHGSEVCGVIARSAGVWQNDKQVCACSGKTVWQERLDAMNRNITK